jgi:putative addiction module CopG family antidote
MNLSLGKAEQRAIEQRVRAGKYASPEDVVRAGLAALEQQESFGDFAPGELDALLAEGERSIRREGTVDAAKVFGEIRQRSRRRRARTTA